MSARRESVVIYSKKEKLAGVLFLPGTDGPSPALVICHGAGEFKENYFELSEYLAKRGVASLALDMHGHGASEGERFHVNISDWVEDIQAAVSFLSEDARIDRNRIGAFGLSSGGTAILEAALVEPRLKALVALDCTVRNSMPLVPTLILKLLVWFGRIKKAVTKHELRLPLIKWFGGITVVSDPEINQRLQSDPKAIEAFMSFPLPGAASSFFVNTIKRVSGISIPAMIIWGEEDKLDPPQTAKMLFECLTCKKQLHIIKGNGHAGHLDRHREQVFALTTDWALENLA
jgi:alpha-beta hydrolase superfamily lysophospholipase